MAKKSSGGNRPTKVAAKKVYRDSKSGEFVERSYAEKHPSTTQKESRPTGSPPVTKETKK